MHSAALSAKVVNRKPRRKTLWQQVVAGRYLLLMLAVPIILVTVFEYGPMYGLQIAWKDYRILDGIWKSPWVGWKHFQYFFTNPVALNVLRNTVEISLLRLLCGFPAPILLALLIGELADGLLKRVAQSLSYLPHFLSWVVIAALFRFLLSPGSGPINAVIKALGLQPIYFLVDPTWFRVVLIASGIWKEVGWGSIVYLAALANVDPTLHEAAVMDGASRLQRIRYISLPALAPVMSIVLILSMGGILNAGFDQIFNMYNPRVYDAADIIDTFVYRVGLLGMDYSFTAAIGVFKSVVSLILVLVVNAITRRTTDETYTLW